MSGRNGQRGGNHSQSHRKPIINIPQSAQSSCNKNYGFFKKEVQKPRQLQANDELNLTATACLISLLPVIFGKR
jgi:hypothetical protein